MMQKLLIAALISLSLSTAAQAASIEITQPWAKAQADAGKPGGIFMTIVNRGPADKLVSISTPAAKMAQLHNNKMKHGKMRMRRKTGMDVGPNASVKLADDGLHIMLMGLASPLKPGASFPVTLKFEKAGEIKVDVPVR